MDVAIVGGNGKIARLLHPLLVEAGHRPVALARREAYRPELEALGAELRVLDIENASADDFAEAFAGCDAVVFSAGGGPDGNAERKRTVDLEGSLKSFEAARAIGIKRFVQVSAIDVDKSLADDVAPVWAAYVAAKRDADIALRASDLDWTILRPGRLTDEPGTGLVALGDEVPRADITRADVAATITEVLDRSETIGKQWNLVGGTTAVSDAVATAVN